MVVIAIDGTVRGGYKGPVGFVSEIYDLGQQHVMQLAVPEMIRRATTQDLADLFEEKPWLHFYIPKPRGYQYLICSAGAPPIETRLRLSAEDRALLDKAAADCFQGQAPYLTKLLDGTLRSTAKYSGILGAADLRAWDRLVSLASELYSWRLKCDRFASVDEVRSKRGLCRDGAKFYLVDLKFQTDIDRERTGYVFETREQGRGLLLYATPVEYRKPGRVSLVLHLSEEIMSKRDIYLCLALADSVRGGDLKGARASVTSPIFIPYGFHTYERCI
jgi:hypothetical protein